MIFPRILLSPCKIFRWPATITFEFMNDHSLRCDNVDGYATQIKVTERKMWKSSAKE